MRPVLLVVLGFVSPLLFCGGLWAQSGGGGKFATSLCAELIEPNNYTCIENQAITDDGFILGLQNIPSPQGKTTPSGGPPVVLMHGIIAAGDNFVANSPKQSLGFVLADAGFDVWIANNRAVQWSHGHQYLTPSQNAYWNWTYDELASYDLKAVTNYIYNKRNQTKLTYIGHSQGTLMLFAGLTGGQFKTEILGYLNAAVQLAPVAYVTNLTAPIIRLGLEIYSDEILGAIGPGEFNANIFFNITCTSSLIKAACSDIYYGVLGNNSYLNQSRLGFYSQYYPQATSSFNVNHFGQSSRWNTFKFYARGLLGGIFDNPPKYDLRTFPTSLPIQLWTGDMDGLADPIDVETLLNMLPSSNREVNNLPNYGHVDFTYGTNAYKDVYPKLITFLIQHASIKLP
ncbi:unnamed protein product [Calypogeia fissa]